MLNSFLWWKYPYTASKYLPQLPYLLLWFWFPLTGPGKLWKHQQPRIYNLAILTRFQYQTFHLDQRGEMILLIELFQLEVSHFFSNTLWIFLKIEGVLDCVRSIIDCKFDLCLLLYKPNKSSNISWINFFCLQILCIINLDI